MKKLIKKILRESDFDWLSGVKPSEDVVYLSIHYTTGEESNYDYVQGLLLATVPKDVFVKMMGQDPSEVEEIGIYDRKGLSVVRYMEDNRDVSIDRQTEENIEPDIQDGWTQGTITIEDKTYYDNQVNRFS